MARSLLPTTARRFSVRWRSNIRSPSYSSNYQKVRTTKSGTGLQASLVRRFSGFFICFIHSLLHATVLAGALLEQSEALLDKGIHPIRIADGFDRACAVAVAHLDKISDTIEYSKENTANLLKASMTSLGSKMYVLLSLLSFQLASLTGFTLTAYRKHMKNSPRSPSMQCFK
jgi:hypothetical protein